MKTCIITVLALIFTAFLQCTESSRTTVGNTTPAVQGVLRFTDGSSAGSVTVQLRSRRTIADLPSGSMSKRNSITPTTTTDRSGRFSFEDVEDSDIYIVEASTDTLGILIDSVIIDEQLTPVTLEPATLEPMGTLKGTAALGTPGNQSKVYLLIFGLDRFAEVDSDGSFIFSDLPPGNYDLRFVTLADDFSPFDTAGIAVTAAETTVMEGITLQYGGIPVPDNLAASYDTLGQKVTLAWTPCDTSLITGYTVFRRNLDSNTVFTAVDQGSPASTPLFIDSTCLQDYTYEYRVCATGTNGTAGLRSNLVSVTIATWFEHDTTINLGTSAGTVSAVAITPRNELYLLDHQYNKMHVFDEELNCQRSFPLPETGHPRLFVPGNNDSCYFTYQKNDTVLLKLADESGTSFKLRNFLSDPFFSFTGEHILAAADSVVTTLSPDCAIISKDTVPGAQTLYHTYVVSPDLILFSDYTQHKIFACDHDQNVLWNIVLPFESPVFQFAYDQEHEHLYLFGESSAKRTPDEQMLYVLNRNSVILANYRIRNESYLGIQYINEISVHFTYTKDNSIYLITSYGYGKQTEIEKLHYSGGRD